MLTPMVPATAMGPGVGITMAWVTIRPTDRAVTRETKGILPFLERDLTRFTRMTKAASKNTGIDTM